MNLIPASIKSRFMTDRISLAPAFKLADLALKNKTKVAFPLSTGLSNGLPTYNGSAAIYQIARILELGQGSTVLLPAYCCGSEQEALVRIGCNIRYYQIKDDLQLDLSDILEHLNSEICLVYVTHFFGFPQEEVEELCRICTERSVPVLEDCALSLYSRIGEKPLGMFGDYAVFSERKSLALTEGGYLVSNKKPLPEHVKVLKNPPLIPRLDRLLNSLITSLNEYKSPQAERSGSRLLLLAVLPLSICIKIARVIGQRVFNTWLPPDIEGQKAVSMYDYGMSKLMLRLFKNTDSDRVVEKRRKHYKIWLEAIDAIPGCTPLFPVLPDGCSPLYMPVLCSERENVMAYMEERKIEASPWWYDERADIDWDINSNLLPIKRNMLVIPVHHEIDTYDLRRRLAA